MGIDLDFTGVEATSGAGLIDEGDYRCIIDSAKETTSSQGTPGVEVVLKITGGDFADRLLWDRIWFTPKAMGMAKWKLQCAGLPIPEGRFTLNPANLAGRPVNVTVRHEEYDGKKQAKVKGWALPDAAASSAATRSDDLIPF